MYTSDSPQLLLCRIGVETLWSFMGEMKVTPDQQLRDLVGDCMYLQHCVVWVSHASFTCCVIISGYSSAVGV